MCARIKCGMVQFSGLERAIHILYVLFDKMYVMYVMCTNVAYENFYLKFALDEERKKQLFFSFPAADSF